MAEIIDDAYRDPQFNAKVKPFNPTVVRARVHTYLLLRDTLKQIEERNAALDEKTRMLESLSVKLSKYLSPQVYASIFAGSRDVELATERKRLTVFFSDIKDFTSTTPTCSRKI